MNKRPSCFVVTSEESNLRLDRWIRRHFPTVSHGNLENMLRRKFIRVNGKRAKSNFRLEAGQTIKVPLNLKRECFPVGGFKLDAESTEFIRNTVIYRDDDILALNKPPGLAVQGGSKIKIHVDAMLDGLRFGEKERPRLVHRLDKDTSGVLLLGRTPLAAASLARAFRMRHVEKTYWAIVSGMPEPRNGSVNMSLGKSGDRLNEKMHVDDVSGQYARTDFITIKSSGGVVAWLALRPLTGRTHQIRVHCAAIGNPILGDGKYGGKQALLSTDIVGHRLHLHSHSIALVQPNGEKIRIEAPVPKHLSDSMDFFGFDRGDYSDPFL